MSELTLIEAIYAFVAGMAIGGLLIMRFLKGDTCSACDAPMQARKEAP
jgi:uncharacterized membrane-anchored protein YhcB (DUF1043 family)